MVGIAIVVLQASVAIMGGFLLWPKNPPRFKRALIVAIAVAWIGDAALESIERHRSAIDRDRLVVEQGIMKIDLDVLKNDSEQAAKEKAAISARNRRAKAAVDDLIREGIRIKRACLTSPDEGNLKLWEQKSEKQLTKIDSVDADEFRESETPLICYQRAGIDLSTLRTILHRYD
jgi:hypothetical protein